MIGDTGKLIEFVYISDQEAITNDVVPNVFSERVTGM